ncbi:calcium/proton exchanger [Acidobacteriota bacterium]
MSITARKLLKPSLDHLLIFVPLCIALKLFWPHSHTAIFITACIAILPLAGWLGKATEHLADKTSEGLSGLINATFGNAAEFIIGLMALRRGLLDIVKASLTGSIIGNILLVMGAAFLAGGVRFKSQRFNAAGARSQATMLTLAAIALILPAMFHSFVGEEAVSREFNLSLCIAIVLLLTYGIGLIFSLHTHKNLFRGRMRDENDHEGTAHQPWSVRKSITVLLVSAGMVGLISEFLVGSVEHTAESLGMTEVFVGVIVVAIIGNAAEHSTAILAALKNRMDMSITISIGSSIQVALFVAPVLLIASYFIAPKPMDLVFTLPEVLAIALAVWITNQIAADGESNWLEGVQLLSVYIILAIVFYFLP